MSAHMPTKPQQLHIFMHACIICKQLFNFYIYIYIFTGMFANIFTHTLTYETCKYLTIIEHSLSFVMSLL